MSAGATEYIGRASGAGALLSRVFEDHDLDISAPTLFDCKSSKWGPAIPSVRYADYCNGSAVMSTCYSRELVTSDGAITTLIIWDIQD